MTRKANNIILYVEHPWLLKDVKYLLTSCFKAYLWVDAWLCILHILAWFCTLHNSCPPPSILVLTKLMHDCAYYIFLHGFAHCTILVLHHQHLFWLSWCMNLHNTYFLHGYAHYTISCPLSSILFLIKKIKKNWMVILKIWTHSIREGLMYTYH
jgi:hypothetical protein